MDTPPAVKRPSPSTEENGPPSKKVKNLPEVPAHYSDAVRKKLAATSRTGQACDRCKERKMKCDADPIACQPCRQKSLRCYTTDRVTGQARERGESSRTDNELLYLREQLAEYQHRYGPLQRLDTQRVISATPTSSLPHPLATAPSLYTIPDSRYVGWPTPGHAEPLHSGPVNGTIVDVMDGTIDIADWPCEMMQEGNKDEVGKFNLSKTSIVNTITGYQRVEDPRLPSKEDGLKDANHFLVIMAQYIPIVHRPSFLELVNRFYDQPASLRPAERAQVVMVFAIIAHQTAVRNHQYSAEKFEDAHRYLHYALGFYRELFHDPSIASMQTMAFMIIHFRNLPKPGVSWTYSHKVLVRAIDLEYHRDPDKIKLPPGEDDPLSKELRKRIFHSMLGVCVTTGCRVGLPAPWQFQHIDLPLPRAIKESEISKQGIVSELSGLCDFWPCLHLAKLLPLLTELHNNIHAVRRPPSDYLKTVETLNTKIIAWRQDWDECIKSEPKHVNLLVATLLMETWAAEYQLNLHHPVCCTSEDPEVQERNLEMCQKSARRLLQAFHTLSSKYKGVDFTWHSTSAYATGFGITLYYYRRRLGRVSVEQFESMRNELKGWISLMAYADLVLRTGNHLQRLFQPRVQALEYEYKRLMADNSIKSPPAQSLFTPVNGNFPVQLKQETLSPIGSAHPEAHPKSLPQPIFMHSQNPVHNQMPPHSPLTHATQSPLNASSGPHQSSPQWPPPPFSTFLPQPNGVNQASSQAHHGPSSPLYPLSFNNTQSPVPASLPVHSQSHSIPTSLASLLNEPGASMYVSYPTPPLTQNALSGGDPTMTFSPTHYFDGHGSIGWPLITMPPGQQS